MLVLVFTAGLVASACTVIFVPGEGADGVIRCKTSQDCPELEDNRWRLQCVYGQDQPQDTDKICAPYFEQVECSPGAYPDDHPFALLWADATNDLSRIMYGQCDPSLGGAQGMQGCPAIDGVSCEAGLEVREDGICDDPNASSPAVYGPDVGGAANIAGQDVRDQFCRARFCDEAFVCDTSGLKRLCKPCEGNDPEDFGSGGCGTLFVQGARSPVYTDLAGANCSGDQADEDVELGTAPVQPSMP
ncbi:hypothetical protein DB30_00018 [Enhygromyxa salina]|uniref:Uncharacterized protein n=1 Tax=Enhygromyxa salina TaxID=215803 RepID=A0A0C1ZPD8_9BACT|nr:hypothetical protein DB30_00018 [Enhygromyxa salina]